MADLTSKCKYVCKFKKNSSLDVLNPNFFSCIYFMLQLASAFIKADASNKTDNDKQQPTSPKQVRRFGWTRFIELAILPSIVIGAIWLISQIVTPQVVTVVSVIAGFLIVRFIVRIILKVTFMLLSILFWLAIVCAILLCVL